MTLFLLLFWHFNKKLTNYYKQTKKENYMTTLNVVRPGIGNTSSFQSSGIPWVKTETISSGNSTSMSFNLVTKFISVTNGNSTAGENLKVAFSTAGLTSNYFLVGPGQTVTLEVKVTDVYLAPAGAYAVVASLAAGLTNIDASQVPDNWSGWDGV